MDYLLWSGCSGSGSRCGRGSRSSFICSSGSCVMVVEVGKVAVAAIVVVVVVVVFEVVEVDI